jgi:hypothetical protein
VLGRGGRIKAHFPKNGRSLFFAPPLETSQHNEVLREIRALAQDFTCFPTGALKQTPRAQR